MSAASENPLSLRLADEGDGLFTLSAGSVTLRHGTVTPARAISAS